MPRATTRGEAPLDTEPPTVERSADPLVGRPPNRLDAGVASLVALVTMVVAVVWRSPIVPTDPWHYVQSAESFPKDDWIPLGFTRYGVVLPNGCVPEAFAPAPKQPRILAAGRFWDAAKKQFIACIPEGDRATYTRRASVGSFSRFTSPASTSNPRKRSTVVAGIPLRRLSRVMLIRCWSSSAA